jgi:BspA type Leucine rich repeat region (6 copies)
MKLLPLMLLLALPVTARAQFNFTTNSGALTITGYTGPGGAVTIPATTNGYPITSIGAQAFSGTGLTSVTIPDSVTSIGQEAFYGCTNLTNAMIPNSVTSIGQAAFDECTSLTSVTVPNGVTSIGEAAFIDCTSLTSVTIPNSVTNIAEAAFDGCTSLTSVTIPHSVTGIGEYAFSGSGLTNVTIPNGVASIGTYAFEDCTNLTSSYFLGNAPVCDETIFSNDLATAYDLPGTTGWGSTFGGVPTTFWYQPQPQVLSFEPSFGVQNNQFGFTISWATNVSVIVQACTNPANPVWLPVSTNLLVGGTSYFSDLQWTNYPGRFYRLSSP